MKTYILLGVLLLTTALNAQLSGIKNFPRNASSLQYNSALVTHNNNFYFFYYDSISTDVVKIAVSKSSNGNDWSGPYYLDDAMPNLTNQIRTIAAASFKGKLFVVYKNENLRLYSTNSTNGTTWSTPVETSFGITAIAQTSVKYVNLYATSDTLYVSANTINFGMSADLITWKNSALPISSYNFSAIPYNSTTKAVAYEAVALDGKIYFGFFVQSSLQNVVDVLPAGVKGYNPRLLKSGDGNYYIVFNTKNKTTLNLNQWDVAYVKSTDNAVTWSQPVYFTTYPGFDFLTSAAPDTTVPIISFFSERTSLFNGGKKPGISYAPISVSPDPDANSPVLVLNTTSGNSSTATLSIRGVFANLLPNDVLYVKYKNVMGSDSLLMYDDGLHGDSLANDLIWGCNKQMRISEEIIYTINIKRGNQVEVSAPAKAALKITDFVTGYLFDVNKIKMPLDNMGTLADVTLNGNSGAVYDDEVAIFSSGFYLSGVTPTKRWANAVASASRVQDYAPGRISTMNDPKPILFVVKNADAAFSQSWMKWKDAVTLGAEFYDGNNDGVYNPVDLNNNGVWDSNEDKPFILGDAIAWCVYNDMVPSSLRRFNDVEPQGIEIQQSVFASHLNDGLNSNTIYVRYKIFNKSYTAEKFDSVYFSLWSDPDIGNATNDIVGSDTLLNSGFAYNDTSKEIKYGYSSPAVMLSFLQGPQTYIPGVTFIDNNSNGVYDEGTDTPLDTAYAKMGPLMGVKKYPGAKNIKMSSFVHYQASDPLLGDPNYSYELMNYQKGNDRFGGSLDPCTWVLGGVFGGVNCTNINKKYWYSGDPVTKTGWINTKPTDQRMVVNIGPFTLPYGKSVDIIAAYNIGRGNSALNSITTTRNITKNSRDMYAANFALFPLGINDDAEIVKGYRLEQNYPNPFNPSTSIEFSIPSKERVMLRIYDILGREVKVLVNEIKEAGNYKVQLNASTLPSGVYFYKLNTDSYSSVKKMLLIK